MVVDPLDALSARILAIAAFVFFVPVVVSFAIAPGLWWVNYPGIFFHLSLFLLVAKLDAPSWAKAAGYGWLLLDVTTGVLSLNNVPPNVAMNIRFGGHIFAGIWIGVTSLTGSRLVKIVGVVTGLCMSGYSFICPFEPQKLLAPASLFWLIWLAAIAIQDGQRAPVKASPTGGAAQRLPA